jgi:hypothetical protein
MSAAQLKPILSKATFRSRARDARRLSTLQRKALAWLPREIRVSLGIDDTDRTERAIKGAEGRRLTYRHPRRRARVSAICIFVNLAMPACHAGFGTHSCSARTGKDQRLRRMKRGKVGVPPSILADPGAEYDPGTRQAIEPEQTN